MATPTTRGSGYPLMFIHDIPDQWHGFVSFSFQSEKTEAPDCWSTADFRERRDRPSGERHKASLGCWNWRKNKDKKSETSLFIWKRRWSSLVQLWVTGRGRLSGSARREELVFQGSPPGVVVSSLLLALLYGEMDFFLGEQIIFIL